MEKHIILDGNFSHLVLVYHPEASAGCGTLHAILLSDGYIQYVRYIKYFELVFLKNVLAIDRCSERDVDIETAGTGAPKGVQLPGTRPLLLRRDRACKVRGRFFVCPPFLAKKSNMTER